jgi:FkbM family methyltransferase
MTEKKSSEIATRYGVLSAPNPGGDIIGRHLARFGEWGWDEVNFVASVLPSDCARVLDIGAFIGTFGIGLAKLRDLGALYFVEANANVAPVLKNNIQRVFASEEGAHQSNHHLRPIVIEAMVAAPGAPIVPGCGSLQNIGGTSFLSSSNRERAITAPPPIQAITLADLRAQYGNFDLIKLDVEGMELEILRSDAQVLSQGNTTLWIECNEDPRSLEVMNLLATWQLDIYYFAFPAHNPDNIYKDATPIFPFAYEAGLLVAPKMRPALSDVLKAHRCILRSVSSVQELKNALWHTPRWGMKEWTGASPEEIAALAGRALRGENYGNYLKSDIWRPNAPVLDPKMQSDLAKRLEQEHTNRLVAEKLASERLALLESEQQRLAELERFASERLQESETQRNLKIEAEKLASDRLASLESERQHSIEVEELLAWNADRVLSLLAQLEQLREEKLDREKTISEQLDLKNNELLNYRNCISSIENSLSWKITKPLRFSIGRNSKLAVWLRSRRLK